jgi:L-alanine-DL-glutamate epimerase-like enolase superfamily enzyme
VHLAAAQPREGWVEWFDWLDPLFEERLELQGGRVRVPDRPGIGLTLSPRASEWLVDRVDLPDR